MFQFFRYQRKLMFCLQVIVLTYIIFLLIRTQKNKIGTQVHTNKKFLLVKENLLNLTTEQTTFFGKSNFSLISNVTENGTNNYEENTESTSKKQVLDSNIYMVFNGIKVIHPGTKWCGRGNLAKNVSDLGKYSKSDACCREHDLCPDKIRVGENKHGLDNTGFFTRSNCDCDKKFYDCLKDDRSKISRNIGFAYFTLLRPQCFKEEHTINNCAQSKWGRCIKYNFKKSGEKHYQWFDNPLFPIFI